MSGRVDEDQALAFLLVVRSGVVHVLASDGADAPQPPLAGFAAVLAAVLTGGVRTLCGRVVVCNRGGLEAHAHRVTVFNDDALCRSCHRALGPMSWRAFEHLRPQDLGWTAPAV